MSCSLPRVPLRTLDESEPVLDRLDHALLPPLVGHLEGLVQQLDLGGAFHLVPAIDDEDEADPVAVAEGKAADLDTEGGSEGSVSSKGDLSKMS